MNDKPTIDVSKDIQNPYNGNISKTIPLAFDNNISYIETLYNLRYLVNECINNVNTGNNAIEELQNLYNKLTNYINNYFKNLDVQKEINNKLDSMNNDGTLNEIINQEIFSNLNNNVNTNTNNIKTINNNLKTLNENDLTELMVIGDSYTALPKSTWSENLAKQLKLNLHKSAVSGMGYVRQVNNQTFIDIIPTKQDYLNKVKYFICYGGINDYNATRLEIETNVDSFIKKAMTYYPNAQIIIVGPQRDKNISVDVTNKLENQIIGIKKACLKNGVCYVNASNWLINTEYLYTETYDTDRLHPSDLGYKIITNKMLSIINNDIDDDLNLKVELYENNNGICFYKNCKTHTHFSAKINNITVNKGQYTLLLNVKGMSDNNININLTAYLDNNDYYPVYKINNDNVTEFIGCAKFQKKSDETYDIRLVSIVDTFTGNISICGDIYFNVLRTN